METIQARVREIVNEAHNDAKASDVDSLEELRDLIAAIAEAIADDLEEGVWPESYLLGVGFGKARGK